MFHLDQAQACITYTLVVSSTLIKFKYFYSAIRFNCHFGVQFVRSMGKTNFTCLMKIGCELVC